MPSSSSSAAYPVPHLPYHAILVVEGTVYDGTNGYPGGLSIFTTTVGDLTLTPAGGGTDIVLTDVPAFTLIPFRVSTVKAASTAVVVGVS